MDNLAQYRQIIKTILENHASIPYSYGNIQQELIIDTEQHNFLLMNTGWENNKRIHGCVVHIAIINDKIWIQRDGIEQGITRELLDAGIPKNKIVLGFQSPSVRQYTEFAVN